MTSFIKNQILKHLTKYTKNLSPEKIKINAFKGEGDVFNLELDENKLTELLELPNWLKIKRAACNKVSIKVQWTLIKKQPIILVLDDVIISVEALDNPRISKFPKEPTSQTQNSYGFIDRVIDGMMIKINMVRIVFSAKTFKASMELTRVSLSSKMPNWSNADHLKKTRIKSVSQGIVILFKEIEWDSTRIEANCLQDCLATPVKLITNATKIRLTMKKSLIDQSLVESKTELILIDLFWVLTISQIKAAILFTESLKEIISQSNELNKEAKIHSEITRNTNATPELTLNGTNLNWSFTNPINNRQKLFLKYNLKETSYHILVSRVEFHFCEESDQTSFLTKNSVINGSVKFLLTNSQVDLYPYHVASMTRDHFPNYKEIYRIRNLWISNVYSNQIPLTVDDQQQLMESVTLIRFNDINMYCVSTAQKTNNCLFISSDIIRHKLPEKTTTFFLDITDHYWINRDYQNVPEKAIFCQINPISLNLDTPTILWLNAFQLSLKNELKSSSYATNIFDNQEPTSIKKSPAIHIEAIMPRIILTPNKVVSGQPDRPQQIQIQVGTLSIDNVIRMNGDSNLIQQVVQDYQKSNFYNGHNNFLLEMTSSKLNSNKRFSEKSGKLGKTLDRSLWEICFDPLWIDYEGAKSYNNKPKPFLDSIHWTLWISIPYDQNSDIGIICKLRDRLEIRFDHYQLLLLYRIMESMSSAMSLMQEDEKHYSKQISNNSEQTSSMICILQIEQTTIRMEWPASPIIMNCLTECSTPHQLKLNDNFEEEFSETSDNLELKNIKTMFELETLSFHNSQFSPDMSKVPSNVVHSHQASPTNMAFDDSSSLLQSNRRSYTSLMAMNKSISNGKNLQSSSSNLLTYKSVKNLFSSGKISRRGSQNSLNYSEAEKMSADSDTSDWISDGLLNDLDIGEDPLNESFNGISIEADGLLESNSSSSASIHWINFEISDFKWIIGSSDTFWINFGIFGNVVVNESQRAEYQNKCKSDYFNNEDANTAKILGRIEYPSREKASQNPVNIDVRVTKEMEYSLLMSTIVSLGEIFEDEISPSEKYSDTIIPPSLRIHFFATFSFEMIENRACNNLSCPSEHCPMLVKIPPGMIITIEGLTVILFEFNQIFNEKTVNGPNICQRCAQRMSPLSGYNTNQNSLATSPILNTHEHIRFDRGVTKNKDFSSMHLKMLQQQNKHYQEEIIRLRSELQSMRKNQDDLRNLIESPSTHFI